MCFFGCTNERCLTEESKQFKQDVKKLGYTRNPLSNLFLPPPLQEKSKVIFLSETRDQQIISAAHAERV